MWLHVVFEQVHFIGNIFAALVVFGIGWLFLDAWLVRRTLVRELTRSIGCVFVSLGFLAQATHIESPLFTGLLIGGNIVETVSHGLFLVGYVVILISVVTDPLPVKPKTQSPFTAKLLAIPLGTLPFTGLLPAVYALLALSVGILYLRRATTGLERHLLPVSVGFLGIGFSHALSMSSLFRTTTNVAVYDLVAPFGPFWIVEQAVLLVAIAILGRWVFGYLLKRFETQLFMITTVGIVGIFLITSITFTSILLYNVQQEALGQLSSNAKVLSYALEGKKSEMLADAEVVAATPLVVDAMRAGDSRALRDIAEQYLLAKRLSSLVITDRTGQVLARGEDTELFGDSLSGDAVFRLAELGETATTIAVSEGVLGQELIVRAASPVRNGNEHIGVVIAATALDSAFVDGIKRSTELESTVYAGDRIAATTLVANDGVTRPVGVRMESGRVRQAVLTDGREFAGSDNFLGKEYLVVYTPVADTDNTVVGMLFAGRPQEALFAAAGRSFELSFIAIVFLLILSVMPSYAVARYISGQIK